MKKTFFFIFFIFSFLNVTAQNQQNNRGAQPDLPGMLLFDYGVNILFNQPEDFEISNIRSRSIGIHYLYPIALGDSKFSFHPGLGFSFHNYTFENEVTLSMSDSTEIVPLDEEVYPDVGKSKFSVHYFNIPAEFRFFADDDYRGFSAALGGLIGRRIISYSKIKFSDDEFDKFRREFNLNPWRYGAYARVGFRGIMLTGQYMFSEIFQEDEGPQSNTLIVGITVSLF